MVESLIPSGGEIKAAFRVLSNNILLLAVDKYLWKLYEMKSIIAMGIDDRRATSFVFCSWKSLNAY